MNNLYKIFPFLFLLGYLFFSSCKNQCRILEEKIKICKEEVDCSLNRNKTICDEIDYAESLISTVNKKFNEDNENKNNVEAACSYSLDSIDFGLCSLAPEKQNGNWQSIKYLMSNFGMEGALDKVNYSSEINVRNDIDTEFKCGKKIIDFYKDTENYKREVRFVFLKTFSDVIPLLQISPKDKDSNIFIGDTYVKNENSQCDFNANNRLNIDYNDYDYIFCSKSSGWLYYENENKSDCALTREEVFLINWKNEYFVNWCLDNYKRTYSDCKKGNTYKCISSSHELCYEIRENFYCNSVYFQCIETCENSSVRTCREGCKDKFIECKKNLSGNNNCSLLCLSNACQELIDNEKIYNCYEYYDVENDKYDYSCCNCNDKCVVECEDRDSKNCKICTKTCLNNCLSDNKLDVSCYKNNMAKINTCINKLLDEPDYTLQNCISENKSFCEMKCGYEPCMYECLSSKCKEEECFENSDYNNDFFENKPCNEYSCYYQCQKECQKQNIDTESSKIFTFYREVKDSEVTGSNCNEEDIFTKSLNGDNFNNFCIVNQNISGY